MMNPSELKYQIEQSGKNPFFFSRDTMRFFGDRMSNYGVRSATITCYAGDTVECWELYRKRPVREGLQASAYFDKATFERRFPHPQQACTA